MDCKIQILLRNIAPHNIVGIHHIPILNKFLQDITHNLKKELTLQLDYKFLGYNRDIVVLMSLDKYQPGKLNYMIELLLMSKLKCHKMGNH